MLINDDNPHTYMKADDRSGSHNNMTLLRCEAYGNNNNKKTTREQKSHTDDHNNDK